MTRALIGRVVFSQHADFKEIPPCERLHVHFLSDCSSNPAYGWEGRLIGATDVTSFVGALQSPRAILIIVKAGPPIDEVISQLKPHLDRGDVLIDGGNSFYMGTQRRLQELATDGILYLGMGLGG